MNSNDTSMDSMGDEACTAVNQESGNICGERSGLQILNEFRKLYETRIQSIDPSDKNCNELKIKIMDEWIQDLDAQNVMLVKTVQELEETAYQRVKILEDKLKHTSTLLTENMSRFEQPTHLRLNNLSERIDFLENEENFLKQKIKNLQNDIGGLIELVRRGYYDHRWNLEGITFCEINKNDIPISLDGDSESAYESRSSINKDLTEMGDDNRVESLKQQLKVFAENERKNLKYQDELHEKISSLENKLETKEEQHQKYLSKLKVLKNNLQTREDLNHDNDIVQIIQLLNFARSACSEEEIEKDINEDNKGVTPNDNQKELINLKKELQEKINEIERLTKQLDSIEKEALESREALTLEVAEKHDQIMLLKEQVAVLEEQCRHTNMQAQFKDDIIKEMRNQLKEHMKPKASSLKSPTSIKKNQKGVKWDSASLDQSSEQDESECDGALIDLKNIKTTMKTQQYELVHLKNQLMEVLDTLNVHEKKAYEKGIVDAHKKLQDMENLLENYNSQSFDGISESSGIFSNTSKLTGAIELLSKISLEKSSEIIQLELILHNLRERNDKIQELSETRNKHPETVEKFTNLSREDFNAMEEFRMCTVEAQAATEELVEEMTSVICNLDCRHKLFNNLKNIVEKSHNNIVKTQENISTVINSLKDQIEVKIISKETIMSGEIKLKDLKNEINEFLGKFKYRRNNDSSTDQEKLTERQFLTLLDLDNNFCNNLMDKVIEEIEYILCNLGVFISKEDSSCEILVALRDQLYQAEQSLTELHKYEDRVSQDNEKAKNIYDEKKKKLDKLEKMLDYAHTRMQDNLEDIVVRSQSYNSFNNSSYNSQENALTIPYDDKVDHSNIEIDQLKKAATCKDKLLEHKDEIIRIQKDSIQMTQEELKDLHRRLQKQIDAQMDIINQHLEEKKYLLEQSELQNQTIKHLQSAVVEAKKNLDRHSTVQRDKSTIELAVSDVWTSITPTVFNNGDVQDI